MGKRQKGSPQLPWTGERYVPEVGGTIALEHLHRYAVACELASGKMVLDIACGEGYGTAMLAKVAQRVIGVDNSDLVIAHATRKYRKPNLEFRIGSCAEIPLPDGCLDLVVSFETIEHHGQHEEMLGEIKRVLKPTGLLFMSSPNKNEYIGGINSSNPFHVKELIRSEFETLLTKFYKRVVFYGQRVIYGSGIFSEAHSGAALTFEKEKSSHSRVTGMSRPLYFLALAG
ncbi:MAG: class I SAM-dependent methyltransferase, partial [Nitrospirales bacterium]|nr:class I SAM-dependent methyltransferase [Nitrospirales bacterium]